MIEETDMYRGIKVLDHGYVRFIEAWGSDERFIESARMSTDGGFKGWGPKCKECGDSMETLRNCPNNPLGAEYVDSGKGGHIFTASGDEKLLKYLYEHKHMTPFEMGGMIIEVQAPIFVFREWHRHRTQSYNEMSSRYTALPDLNYVPTVERLMMNSKKNKQAGTIKGAEELTEQHAEWFRIVLADTYREQEEMYQKALALGVPKELARVHLPVGRYSKMRASAVLRNWLGFETLRLPSDAQWEIRQYAEVVGALIEQHFPQTWELFKGSVRK